MIGLLGLAPHLQFLFNWVSCLLFSAFFLILLLLWVVSILSGFSVKVLTLSLLFSLDKVLLSRIALEELKVV